MRNEAKQISEGIPIAVPIEASDHQINWEFIGPLFHNGQQIVIELALVNDNELMLAASHKSVRLYKSFYTERITSINVMTDNLMAAIASVSDIVDDKHLVANGLGPSNST